MQKIVFLLLFIFTGITSFSQQEFFVYLQADNHQPFYVKINTKIYSSTENGYVIIPKLGDSTYEMVIGFAKNAYPEQSFTVTINKKDKGFQLKDLGEKGWALVDLQNASIIPNSGLPPKVVAEFSGIRKTDAFSEMLANVVNDSSILYTVVKEKPPEAVPEKKSTSTTIPVIKNEPPKDTIKTVAVVPPTITEPPKQLKQQESFSKPDSLSTQIKAGKTDSQVVVSAPATVMTKPDNSKVVSRDTTQKVNTEKPFITKIDEKKTDQMYQAVYLEQYIFSTDTISIVIPLAQSTDTTVMLTKPAVAKQKDSIPDNKIIAEEKAFTAPKPVTVDTTSSKSVIQIINSDCKEFATDYDVDKLRLKLINDKTIDDKLVTAKKYFKTKCFSVKQIKALTELFPSDETKYRFFDTSYPFVSDTNNFYVLEDLIENNYYKTRFKAMIIK